MGDRPRQWLVGLGVVVLFASLFANFYQQRMNGEQAAAYNATSVRQNHEILGALHNGHDLIKSIQAGEKETEILEAEVSGFVAQIHTEVPEIAAGLTAGQNTLIAQYNAIIAKLNSLCAKSGACGFTAPAPSVPVPIATTTTAATTTTTAPKHHRFRG